MNEHALVDILLPVYNGSKYLVQQLESLFNQTYSNIRLIIRDDISTDDTVELIQTFKERYPDKIILIKSEVNLGSSLSFHELLKHSTADYAMFCDQDDVWQPNKVLDSISAINNNEIFTKNVRCVFTDLTVVDEKLNLLHESMRRAIKIKSFSENYIDYLCQSQVTGCTMLLNRAAVVLLQKFPPPNRNIIHDHWYSVILAIYGEIKYFDRQTIFYRQHLSNQVGVKSVTPNYFLKKLRSLYKTYDYDMAINRALALEYQISTMRWCFHKIKLNVFRLW